MLLFHICNFLIEQFPYLFLIFLDIFSKILSFTLFHTELSTSPCFLQKPFFIILNLQ